MDVVVNSWAELHSALFDLYQHPDFKQAGINRFRTPYVFRGLSNSAFPLTTSLQRLNQCEAVDSRLGLIEKKLLFGFRMYSQRDPDPHFSIWYWLSMAQHHGLPTRLMDWTWSPYVAMHFATSDVTTNPHTDAAIWSVNMLEVQKYLPEKLQTMLNYTVYSGFHAEMMDEVARDLETLDRLSQDPFLVFFEPPSLDDRIVNQFGLFSLMSSPTGKPDVRLDQWLESRQTEARDLYSRVIIPAELKWEVRDKLDGANIHERLLFPGLDGLCAWLKRHYSCGP